MKANTKNYEPQIEELLSQLTLEEKISMIHGAGLFRTAGVPRLGIPPLKMSDGPMGVRMEFPDDSWRPYGYSTDYVTYAPSNSALAATWNPERAYAGGKVLGAEARGRGKDVILAPGINIKRDPLCGRNFEYMSEDPYLIETLTVPFIEGVQENDVAACVKHFAANGQETDRHYVDTIVDERTLHEIYYPGFKAAVQEAGSYSLMNAYNKVNGTHCSENKELLDKVLREEWEYDGTVISDWGSVHTTKGTAESSMDVEMSVKCNFDDYFFANPLLQAVKSGEIAEEHIDKKVRNVLRMMFRLKMLGEDAGSRKTGEYNTPEHQQGTLQTAREAIVLLKNEGQLLPLKEKNLKSTDGHKCKIAVIGHNAEHAHAGGGGSAEIRALYEITPHLGLKKALGGNVEIAYAQGYYIPGQKSVNEVNWQEASLERQVMGQENADSKEQQELRRQIQENRERLKKEACELAAAADYVIFVGGLNHDYDVEGRDRMSMELPYGQDELIEALLEVNPDTIMVMVAGSPVEMPWLNRAKALVWCYYAGMETGTALAEVLLGKVNPSGKLPESFPVAYSDTVTARNGQFGLEGRIELKEGIFVGYRYYEKEQITPAYSFGYGMSYTNFKMDNLTVAFLKKENRKLITEGVLSDEMQKLPIAEVTVTLRNVGSMAGAEVVQCYVADCECSVERPIKELKAYRKVFLQPGEEQTVSMILPAKAFTFYDEEQRGFVAEPGDFRIMVGNASNNILDEKILTL